MWLKKATADAEDRMCLDSMTSSANVYWAKITVDAEPVAKPSIAPAGAVYVTDLGDEFIAAVEAETNAGNSTAPAGADEQTHPGGEFTAAVEKEIPASPPLAPAGADRRIH